MEIILQQIDQIFYFLREHVALINSNTIIKSDKYIILAKSYIKLFKKLIYTRYGIRHICSTKLKLFSKLFEIIEYHSFTNMSYILYIINIYIISLIKVFEIGANNPNLYIRSILLFENTINELYNNKTSINKNIYYNLTESTNLIHTSIM